MNLREDGFGLILNQWDLIVSIFLLGIAVVINLLGLLGNLLSFEQSVYISLIAIAAAISNYLFFRLQKEAGGNNSLDIDEVSHRILRSVLSEIRDGDKPSKEHIDSLLKGGADLFVHEREEAYEFAASIANNASEQVILFQHSLILLLGPRPYLDEPKMSYELEQFDLLENLVCDSKDGEIEFYCAYDISSTNEEIKRVSRADGGEAFKSYVASRLDRLFTFSQSGDSEFTLFTPRRGREPRYHFLSGDNRFALWFKDPGYKGRYLCLTSETDRATDIFQRIFRDSFENVTDFKTASTELGLEDVTIDEGKVENKELQDIPFPSRQD